ncbi:hypothetical protein EQG49_13255 [Periweissella cryptocerci]|uniref:Uncharacterized protein n=1 Tax=Periweissella cryptocerci TaxID=2506420 RepID=A0A4P6YWY8_9LACO|nr:hypothetical protein [Periweissella cryptocerci]QBO37364.1 hypothetical protein EQG49_13255 [Periweissella cryptocerci]
MTEKTGTITNRSKRNPFEMIPRDLLQDHSISFGAMGLLSNMVSHSTEFTLHKTWLYTTNSVDGRRVVDKYWQELVEAGYLFQWRKRNGQRLDYAYDFSVERFTASEVLALVEERYNSGWMIYRKELGAKLLTPETDIRSALPESFVDTDRDEIQKMHEKGMSSGVQFVHLNKARQIKDSSGVHSEQLTVSCSARTSNKDLINKDLINDDDDEYVSMKSANKSQDSVVPEKTEKNDSAEKESMSETVIREFEDSFGKALNPTEKKHVRKLSQKYSRDDLMSAIEITSLYSPTNAPVKYFETTLSNLHKKRAEKSELRIHDIPLVADIFHTEYLNSSAN